jgi:hypothetical protein
LVGEKIEGKIWGFYFKREKWEGMRVHEWRGVI